MSDGAPEDRLDRILKLLSDMGRRIDSLEAKLRSMEARVEDNEISSSTVCDCCQAKTNAYKYDELRQAGWRFGYTHFDRHWHRRLLFVCPACIAFLYDLWSRRVVKYNPPLSATRVTSGLKARSTSSLISSRPYPLKPRPIPKSSLVVYVYIRIIG